MKVKVGRYVGDGANPRAFGGLGLAPDVVLIKGADSGLHAVIGFRGATPYFLSATGSVAGAIGHDDDGFTVSSYANVNRDGTEYTYLAIEASGGDAAVGTYLGNGQDDHEITGLGFDPGFVLVRRRSTASGSHAFWRTPDMSAGMSCGGWFGELTGRIKALITDGFRLGTDASANANGATFSYLALADLEGWTARGAYTGNAQDDRNLDVIGWEPDTVIVKSAAGAGAAWRTKHHQGDLAASWNSDAEAANLVQALRAEGFQVGTDARVNSNGQAYRWYALREGDTTAVAVEEKSGWDSAGATESAQAQEYTPPEEIADSDSAGTEKEEAGYWRRERAYYAGGASGPAWVWVWRPGVEAFHCRQDSASATDSATVAHHQVTAEDGGAIVDALAEPPPVEHLLQEPAAAQDEAALWYEIEVSDTDAHGEDGAVIELNPVSGADVGAAGETAHTPLGTYSLGDQGIGLDRRVRLAVTRLAVDAAAVSERAQVVALLEAGVVRAVIDSSLDSLADGLDLELVERNPSAPLTPSTQRWRTLDEGTLIAVRLGLAGVGMDDYGHYRVDLSSVSARPDALVTRISGRDRAALLVEQRSAVSYRWGAYFGPAGEQPVTRDYPTARAIAAELAARAGLTLAWEAPDYRLRSFTLSPQESASAALARLLEPLQVSRRHRTDAWVEGDHLVVRRRGTGPLAGELDCSRGTVVSLTRQRQLQLGRIEVIGGSYTVRRAHARADTQSKAGESVVRETDDGEGARTVETYLPQNGAVVLATRQTTEQVFEDAWGEPPRHGDPPPWLGRLLVEERSFAETDLNTDRPHRERRRVHLGYDELFRLVLRDELVSVYDEEGKLTPTEQTITRYSQITPTEVEVHVTEWEIEVQEDGRQVKHVKAGFPKATVSTGVLHPSIRQQPDPQSKWDDQPDGAAGGKVTEETHQYRAVREGGGEITRVYHNDLLQGFEVCQRIADDLAAESGAWLWSLQLEWPRPFPYRKGDRVTLTGLPGGLGEMEAVLVRLHTSFDRGAARWLHSATLEAWAQP